MPFCPPSGASSSPLLILVSRQPALPVGVRARRRVGARRGSAHCRRAAADHRPADQADRRSRKARSTATREDDAKLVEIRLQLEDLARRTADERRRLPAAPAGDQRRLEQLGPPPAEGQPPEPDIVTGERQALTAEKAEINAVLGIAEIAVDPRQRADRPGSALMRSELFRSVLTKRYDLDDALTASWSTTFRTEFAELLPRRLVVAALRPPVQAAVRCWRRRSSRWWRLRCCWSAGGGCSAGCSTPIRRARSRPISAGCPSRSGRRLLPTAAVGVFLVDDLFCSIISTCCAATSADAADRCSPSSGSSSASTGLPTRCCRRSLPNWRLIPIEIEAGTPLLWLVSAMASVIGVNNFLASSTRRWARRFR